MRLRQAAWALAAAMMGAAAAAPAVAAEPFPKLFEELPLGIDLESARGRLKDAGARIVRLETNSYLADLRCRADDQACRQRHRYVAQIVARHKGALYRVGLTSKLSGNRVYQVAIAANMPRGVDRAAHKAAISAKLDAKPTGRSSIAIWRLNEDGHMLMVSWTGFRYTAIRRDSFRLREDRIAIDRVRRR